MGLQVPTDSAAARWTWFSIRGRDTPGVPRRKTGKRVQQTSVRIVGQPTQRARTVCYRASPSNPQSPLSRPLAHRCVKVHASRARYLTK